MSAGIISQVSLWVEEGLNYHYWGMHCLWWHPLMSVGIIFKSTCSYLIQFLLQNNLGNHDSVSLHYSVVSYPLIATLLSWAILTRVCVSRYPNDRADSVATQYHFSLALKHCNYNAPYFLKVRVITVPLTWRHFSGADVDRLYSIHSTLQFIAWTPA